MLLAPDQAGLDHAVKDDGDARFAHEEALGDRELIHGPAAEGDEIEDVELRVGETEGLKKVFGAALDGVVEGEPGDEEVVPGEVRLHRRSLPSNHLMSNDIFRSMMQPQISPLHYWPTWAATVCHLLQRENLRR